MSLIAKLMLIFTLIPIIEISLLVAIHSAIGGWAWATVALVCCTAILGTILVRWQGKAALQRIKDAIGEGKIPSDEIIDGLLVVVAGTTLITPGILTDATGLLLLIPTIRAPVRRMIKKRVMGWLEDQATSSATAYVRYGDSHGAGYGYGYDYNDDYGPPQPRDEGALGGATQASEVEAEAGVGAQPNLGKPDAIL
ncbi:MAG: FxsA family protein [Myxococcota bacterium]